MDYFYIPPLQRDDECQALEDNYMNCLMQKALKDKVFVNKCVLDSVLWFPIECPKWHAKFDDQTEFKLKFKKFIAETKSAASFYLHENERDTKLKREFSHALYPEDLKVYKEAVQFTEDFKQHDPLLHPVDDPDEEFEPDPFLHTEIPPKDRTSGTKGFSNQTPLQPGDSKIWKF